MTADESSPSRQPIASGKPAPSAPPASPAPLGSTVGISMAWMVGSSVIAKGLSLLAQVALGWFLSDGDFGVFSLTMGLWGLAMFIREGGARDYLIQQGPDKFKTHVGPLFWLAMTITTILAIALTLFATSLHWLRPHLPDGFSDPRLPWLLGIGAATMLLATPAAFTSAKLQTELRFAELTKVQITSSLLRYTLVIALAWAGLGPLAIMAAWLIVQIYELIAFERLSQTSLFREPKQQHLWRSYLSITIWLALGSLGNIALDYACAVPIGLFRDQETIGRFYFAFNLVLQIAVILSFSTQVVLMPALARLRDDPPRQAAAIQSTMRSVMLIAGGLCLGFAVTCEPLMTIIWRGKWDGSVLSAQILAVYFVMRMTYGLTAAILQSQGRFVAWATVSLMEAALLLLASGLGAYLAPGPESPAIWFGAAVVFTRCAITAWTLKTSGIPLRTRLTSLFPAWILAILAASCIWLIDLQLIGHAQHHHWATLLSQELHLRPPLAEILVQLTRAVFCGGLFLLIYAASIRLLLPSHLREAIRVMPARLRGLALKVLALKA